MEVTHALGYFSVLVGQLTRAKAFEKVLVVSGLTVCGGVQVALGLPLLPKVPITKAEAKRRASVKLLPLGMALLAAESFVQERLYSADICKNVLGS